jgi:sugar phosphate isomerase/epimerase
MKWMMFSKHLQGLPLAEAARNMRDLGFEGMDLTVRPGGFVDPARVKTELHTAVHTVADQGLSVPLITTSITSIDDPFAESTFIAAAEEKISEIKLGYVHNGPFGTLAEMVDKMNGWLDGLERLAVRTGVRANLHIHSGTHTTALPALIWYWLKDRNPAAIGAYVDPAHMAVEGGDCGWKMGLDLLAGRISLVAAKDFKWVKANAAAPDNAVYIPEIAPLGEGITPWRHVFACLRVLKFDGWISVHSEYEHMPAAQLLRQTRLDLDFLHRALEASKSIAP